MNEIHGCIKAAVDLNVASKDGKTALMWASERGHEDVVRVLVDARADVDAANERGETALMYAAEGGHEGAARLLIDARADVNREDNQGCTALSRAHWREDDAINALLLDAGAVDERIEPPSSTPRTSRRQHLRNGMAILDEHKQSLPEGAYLALCDTLQASFRQSAEAVSRQNSLQESWE